MSNLLILIKYQKTKMKKNIISVVPSGKFVTKNLLTWKLLMLNFSFLGLLYRFRNLNSFASSITLQHRGLQRPGIKRRLPRKFIGLFDGLHGLQRLHGLELGCILDDVWELRRNPCLSLSSCASEAYHCGRWHHFEGEYPQHDELEPNLKKIWGLEAIVT